MSEIVIRPFQSEDQDAVKRLIQEGLGEHFGNVDPTLNPDLNDIGASYAGATFLVAWLGDRIVGTGAMIARSDQVGEIVRMSVASDMRRKGIASQVLWQLCQKAKYLGFERLILETNAEWSEVIAFYERFGFGITHRQPGDYGEEVYFALELASIA